MTVSLCGICCARARAHTHTHTHTHIHTYTHTHMYARTHTHIDTFAHTLKYVYIKYMYIRIQDRLSKWDSRARLWVPAVGYVTLQHTYCNTATHGNTHFQSGCRAYFIIYIYTYIFICTYINIHIYMHIYMYI